MNTAFPIAPTGPLPGALIFGFLGIVYVSVLGAYIYDQNAARWGLWLATCIVGAVTVFIGAFVFHNRSNAIVISDSGLTLKAPFYGRSIPPSAIHYNGIKILNFSDASHQDFRLARRSNGIGLPRLQLGWFRLHNGDRAWGYVTDPTSLLLVPTNQGYVVLLSTPSPEAIQTALLNLRRAD